MQLGVQSTVHVVAAILFCCIVCTSSCFVRNCPPGGKRSMEEMPQISTQRQCMRCGPQGQGQCLGPNICCGSVIGCYINTPEAASCVAENANRTPCHVKGAVCGRDGQGICASEGVCCTDESCTLDSACEQRDSGKSDVYSPALVDLLKKVFQHRARSQYPSRKFKLSDDSDIF